jgi:hypothetical protein
MKLLEQKQDVLNRLREQPDAFERAELERSLTKIDIALNLLCHGQNSGERD